MKRHPVLFGILLLIFAGLIFFFLIQTLFRPAKDGYSFTTGDKVGIVRVEGVITGSEEVIREVEELAKDDRVKAIVIRIDSPGGSVAPTQEIYDTILEAGKKKKVVASMGSVAASGGYLLACGAEKIVANPGTITGSISAIMHFANVQELMRKVGVTSSVIKSGKFKDIGSPVRDMTDEEKTLIRRLVDDVYEQLVDTVSQRRKMSRESVIRIADGRILTGRQALQAGLVDFLGNQKYAVRLAGKLAGIKGEPEVVYPAKERPLFLDLLVESMAVSVKKALVQEKQRSEGLNFLYLPGLEVGR
ncbi:MAG TPA: signal peptide peptidase SppA [Syntrophales bacterium]|jgi:protease-4|nr:signal peptide peptidase SppA [Syntrophales bacterium]HPX56084.1 signal peptide peptidase SppA [Syntrophales bacterium]HQA83312.1 signal peptide peptidase SppA [Syntrophales bacterium]